MSVESLASPIAQGPSAGTVLDRVSRRVFLKIMAGLEHGRLVIEEGGRRHRFGGDDELTAVLRVHRPGFFRRALFGGSVGAGGAFMDDLWDTDDLVALVRILARNEAVLTRWRSGPARLIGPVNRIRLALSRNSIRGSRRNIEAHYDLSNAFFATFLDPTLMYWAAVFERPETTLDEAAVAKLDRICRKLSLGPGDRVLEIGTGWGGFAIHAATRHGCRVTTTTISREQHAHAVRRVRELGLEDRITVLDRDYRDLEGVYDKLVSIEMVEAVGEQYLDGFFEQCSRLLAPDGIMLLQAIVIDDRRFEGAARTDDFIKHFIFPGSCIPSQERIARALRRGTDLRQIHMEDLTDHYARTLRAWRLRFLSRSDAVEALGFDRRFRRMWEFYLAYCEGGFRERRIGDVQVLLAKSGYRGSAPLADLLRVGEDAS